MSCKTLLTLSARQIAQPFGATARLWRELTASLFDPYRPELHYMRGPGPKWREKRARGSRL
jgi:hypothetical protein